MRNWFRFQNAVDDPSVVDIFLVDVIGDWVDEMLTGYYGSDGIVTAKAFLNQLAQLPAGAKTLNVHINSPGGDVFAAVTIANALRDQQTTKGRTVTTIVDGLAASAASIVMMAGSTVRMADNALVMVHNPMTIGVGNAAEMRKLADELDVVRNSIIATYKWHSTLDDTALIALMDAETWMDAGEAIANGFATEKVEGLKAVASLDRRGVSKLAIPDKFKARVAALLQPTQEAPAAASADDVIRLCVESGLDLPFAQSLIQSKPTLDVVKTKVTSEKQTRAQATARATDIRALCATAKVPELAEDYVAGTMPVDRVKAQLTIITAKIDRVEIDGSLPADQGGRRPTTLVAADIYAARNRLTSANKE